MYYKHKLVIIISLVRYSYGKYLLVSFRVNKPIGREPKQTISCIYGRVCHSHATNLTQGTNARAHVIGDAHFFRLWKI